MVALQTLATNSSSLLSQLQELIINLNGNFYYGKRDQMAIIARLDGANYEGPA